MSMIPAIEIHRRLAESPAQAFERFTAQFQLWWPKAYSWSGDTLVDIGMQCHEGGMCFEIGPHGFHLDWGRVLRWQPTERLVLSWQISPRREPQPDPAQASQVSLDFSVDDPAGCLLALRHDGFERHGEGAQGYRDAMAGEYGWPYILDCFVKHGAVAADQKR